VSSPDARAVVWVMHAGALGDWVLLWPLLRALGRAGTLVIAVSNDAKAKLAAKWIECAPGSLLALPGGIDQPRLSRWWAGAGGSSVAPRVAEWGVRPPTRIISFLADDPTAAGRAWLASAAAEFPGAAIETVGPPGSASRTALWVREGVATRSAVPIRENPAGPIVCHVGAGGESKRWPMERWASLVQTLRDSGEPAIVVAGEAELERFDAAERAAFTRVGGRYIESLEDLAMIVSTGRLFVGADTGPTHLAAQLGIPALALFGPTDPAVWQPVGPAVRTLIPGAPGPMTWLEIDPVHQAAKELRSAHRSDEDLAAIDRGIEDVKAGRVHDMREAIRGIARRLGLPLDR